MMKYNKAYCDDIFSHAILLKQQPTQVYIIAYMYRDDCWINLT